MQTQDRLTPQDVRQFMFEHAKEREEQDRDRPVEQQHAGVDWVRRYWERIAA